MERDEIVKKNDRQLYKQLQAAVIYESQGGTYTKEKVVEYTQRAYLCGYMTLGMVEVLCQILNQIDGLVAFYNIGKVKTNHRARIGVTYQVHGFDGEYVSNNIHPLTPITRVGYYEHISDVLELHEYGFTKKDDDKYAFVTIIDTIPSRTYYLFDQVIEALIEIRSVVVASA